MEKRMTFLTWAKKDPNDETPLKIVLKPSKGRAMKFSSEKAITFAEMERLRRAYVRKVEKVNDVWEIELYED